MALVRAVQPLRSRAVVRAAAGRAARRSPGQSDARHPAGRRARHVLRARRPRTAGQPAAQTSRCSSVRTRRTCSCSTFSRRSATGVTALIDRENGEAPAPTLIPVLRARVVGVRGRDVNLESYEDVRGRGGLGREFTVTYRATLNANETLVERHVVGRRRRRRSTAPRCRSRRASVSASASRSATRCGSTCSGGSITARVTSTRSVDFRDARAGGFMLVFRPGTFDGAPHSYIATVQGPGRRHRADADAERAGRPAFRTCRSSTCARCWPTIKEIVDNVTLAITVVGGLVLFSGSLILIGAVSMTKLQARLRSGDSQDAGGDQPADCDDAPAGVRGARCNCGHGRRAGRHRAQLGHRAVRPRPRPGKPAPSHDRRSASSRRRVRVRRRRASPASTCSGTSRWPRLRAE